MKCVALQIRIHLTWIFPNYQTPAKTISYTYRSVDPQGEGVDLSAVVYLLETALGGTALTGICLTNHGTIASKDECPTKIAQLEGAFAWKNYAMVMPDYYGFGVSEDRPQGYLDAENTAHNNIDAYLAACKLLEDRNVAIPDKLYSFGYSQGGFNSMANLKYVSLHPELGIRFDKVFCGGSPFDVQLTWEKYADATYHNSLAFVPMTVVSMNETQQLGLSYSDLFKGSLLTNWQDWVLSKNYTTSQISDKIFAAYGSDATMSSIMTEGFMSRTDTAYDTILNVCQRYSLTTGNWTPDQETQIILYHSKEDDTVPYDNLQAMTDFLGSEAFVSTYGGWDGGHMEAVTSFITDIIVYSLW